jgi:sulfide:quinone oxidoreductase
MEAGAPRESGDGGAGPPPRIVVAGGGPAALEALLTLAERLPAERRQLVLLAPNRSLTYRPLSAVAEFATHPPRELALADLAAATGAALVEDAVAVVDSPRRRVLTRDGEWLGFDHLLLAVGASALPAPEAWLPWPAQGEPGVLYGLLAAIGSGGFERIAVVVPERTGWPLAGYELAAILGAAADATGSPARVSLLAEARRPLAPLGDEVEALVGAELARAGVEVAAGATVRPYVPPPPELIEDWYPALIRRLLAPQAPPTHLREVEVGGERVEFDLVITLPRSHGRGVSGLPADEHGFIVVDDRFRSPASDRVWAAGDCTTLPVKHSALAVAEADVAADAIASAAGARVETPAPPPTLTGVLVSGAAERWWEENTDLPGDLEPATHCLWWPPGRVLGGRLAHFVAHRDPSAHPLLVGHPRGTAVQIELRPAGSDGEPAGPATDEEVLEHDAVQRRAYAVRRIEHEAEELIEELGEERERVRLHSEEVLARLNAAGYVVGRGPDAGGEA